jgi:hypothetical protein
VPESALVADAEQWTKGIVASVAGSPTFVNGINGKTGPRKFIAWDPDGRH